MFRHCQPRTAFGRVAVCVCAGVAGSRRLVMGWLAVLAILVQTTIPDFAMAARNAARQRAEVAAGHYAYEHHHHGTERRQPETPAPAGGGGEHGTLCAFCLALATHGLAAAPGEALVAPTDYEAVRQPVEQGVRLRPLFLTCLNPRAPSVSAQV